MAAFVKSVEKVSTTFGTTSGAISNTVDLSKSQDETQCVPFYSLRTTAGGTDKRSNNFVACEMIDNAGTPAVRVHRNAGTTVSQIHVDIFIVEFGSNVTVQQGSVSLTGATASDTITAVTEANSFCAFSQVSNGASGDDFNDSLIQARFGSTTSIAFDRRASGNPDWTVYYYIVESDGTDFTTQYVNVSWVSSAQTDTRTLVASAPPATSFLVVSYENSETSDDLRDAICNWNIVHSFQIKGWRDGATPNASLTTGIWVVTANSSSEITVAQYVVDLAASTTNDQTVTGIDQTKAIILNSGTTGAWSVDGTTAGANIEDRQNALTFTSDTNVRATQQMAEASDGTNSRLRFEVVEFALEVAGGDTNISATTDALTLTENSATVNAETNVNASVDALTLTEQAATVSLAFNISASVDSLTLTENAASVNAETNIQASADSLSLTENSATVNAETSIAAGVDALTLTENAASVSLDVFISAGVDALTLTEQSAIVNAETNVNAGTDTLIVTTNQASISVGAGVQATTHALTLTEYPATVNAEINLNAGLDALTLTEQAASISLDVNISGSVDSLVLTEQPATINAETNVNAGVDALNLTEFAASVTTTSDTNISATTNALVLTEYQATLSLVEAAIEETQKGDWLPPAEVKKLLKIRRELDRKIKLEREKKDEEEREQQRELERIFNRINGIEEIAEELQEIVKPFVAPIPSAQALENQPQLPYIDFRRLAAQSEIADRLRQLADRLDQRRQDEEDAITLLLLV